MGLIDCLSLKSIDSIIGKERVYFNYGKCALYTTDGHNQPPASIRYEMIDDPNENIS